MPEVKPASFKTRAGVKESSLEFDEPWLKIPFETYQGMTQAQFQESIAPHQGDGKLVPVTVPKGWRRVEGTTPGKHFYVHMESGTISRFPKEMFSIKQECWIQADGTKVPDEEVMMDPYMRAMKLGLNDPTGHHAYQPVEFDTIADMPAAPAALAAPPPLPVALMFPGQGSEYVKMLSGVKEIPAVKAMMEKAAVILGYDLLEMCLKGPDSSLEQTRYCQPAMFCGGLDGVEKLKLDKPDRYERLQACAGLSLGEYTALCVAGVFDFETGLKIVKLRGELMQEQVAVVKQGMLSVAGLNADVLGALCEQAKSSPGDVCQIANVLFPNGFSCAGHLHCVEKLLGLAQKTDGCLQVKLLKVPAGFHTPLMAPAKDKLLEYLKEIEPTLKSPRCDVYMNATGKKVTPATPPSEIIRLMCEQLVSPVQWEAGVREMIRDGVAEFYECGPMKQLKVERAHRPLLYRLRSQLIYPWRL